MEGREGGPTLTKMVETLSACLFHLSQIFPWHRRRTIFFPGVPLETPQPHEDLSLIQQQLSTVKSLVNDVNPV